MPCYQGTRYTRNFRIRSCSTDAPVDISTWEFRGMIRDNRDDPDPLIELTTANGGWLVINGPGGQLQFTISPAQSLLLPTGRMIMDVLRTDLVLEGPIWVFEATFQVKLPITRDF
jgi:hypothetical protein